MLLGALASAKSLEIPRRGFSPIFRQSQEMPGVPYDRLYVASLKIITNLVVPGVDTTMAWSVFASQPDRDVPLA